MPDMRYLARLGDVAEDAVELIQHKSLTYQDSWKRRGGPGAWFTVVRPWDRLETIVARHGGDIFAAIAEDPSGADGSALACVRDVMNYMILTEAECRTNHGVGRHGPGAVPKVKTIADAREELRLPRPGTPDDGGHHALAEDLGAETCSVCHCGPGHAPDCARANAMERAGEVTQDTQRAGGSAGRPASGTSYTRSRGARINELIARARGHAADMGLTIKNVIIQEDGAAKRVIINFA